MSDEQAHSSSESGVERESAGSIVYLTYAAGAIAASWGLMEILLATDPFWALLFKYGGWLSFVAVAIGLALAAGIGRRLWLAIGAGLGVALFGVSATYPDLVGVQGGAGTLDAAIAPMGLVIVASGEQFEVGHAVILFGLLLAGVGALAWARRRWVRAHVTAPMVTALFAVAVFSTLLTTGRARDLEWRDIALEELRAAGMGYNLDALQNALFFLNDRGLRLYVDAGFRRVDMLLALGRPSEFSGQRPLIMEIIDRVEGSTSPESGGDASAAARFMLMMHAAYGRNDAESYAAPIDFYRRVDDSFVLDAAGGRPLAALIAARGAETLYAALAGAGGGLLYAHALPVAQPAALVGEPEPVGPTQSALLVALDPILALDVARRMAGAPLSPDGDRDALCEIARSLADAGAAPHVAAASIYEALDCVPGVDWRDAADLGAAPDAVRALIGGGAWSGRLARRVGASGCAIERFLWRPVAGETRFVETPAGDAYVVPIRGEIGDVPILGAVHVMLRDGAWTHRLVYGAADFSGGLSATEWSPVRGRSFREGGLLSHGPGHLFVYRHDDGPEERPPSPVALPVQRDGDSGRESRLVGDVLRLEPPIAFAIDLEAAADLTVQWSGPPVDLCVEARASREQPPLAARFAPRGARGELVLPALDPDVGVTLTAAPLAPLDAVETLDFGFGLTAQPPTSISCFPQGEAASAGAPPLVEALRLEGRMPETVAEDLWCPFLAAGPAEVVLTLDGLESDVDVELLYEPDPGAELELIGASFDVSVRPERIEALLRPGRYYVRLHTFGDPGSAFALEVDALSSPGEFTDAFPALEIGDAHEYGVFGASSDPQTITELFAPSALGRVDAFEIELTQRVEISALLDLFSAPLALEIYDAAGALLSASYDSEASTHAARAVAGPGRVRLVVSAGAEDFGEAQTPYRLVFSVDAPSERDLGVLATGASVSERGRVWALTPTVEFAFQVESPTDAVFTLSGLSADADLVLATAAGETLQDSRQGATEVDRIEATLAPGAYVLRVEAWRDNDTEFVLDIAAP